MQPFLPFLLIHLLHCLSAHCQPPQLHLPPDAVSLLSFKANADLHNTLPYTHHLHHCHWPGVKCRLGRVVRLSLNGYALLGTFPPHTLTRLDQLRVLSLRNNSLSGPLPSDLFSLSNLRSLLLDHNSFSGPFPSSLFSLYKLRALDLSFNNFSGILPSGLLRLDRLFCLNLQFNRFNGSLPPLNQSALEIFNVTGNFFSGSIPPTPTLSQFPSSSFALNPDLCGDIIRRRCSSPSALFDSSSAATDQTRSSPPALSNSESLLSPPLRRTPREKRTLILGLSLGALFLTGSFLCMFLATRKQRTEITSIVEDGDAPASEAVESEVVRVRLDTQSKELKDKCKEIVEGVGRTKKSGNLVFCMGEGELYNLEQLMRASAEMLGRGSMGTTYKAKLDNQLIVTVKRLDGIRMSGVDGEVFERHMVAVGALRHPNLVPMRAYFQAKEGGERLIVYDYQSNGSVYNLIHGSRSTRTKPLHWTSCLKIAEDVAQGLSYIHQASKLVHGNLKASNVLLGTDFEACLTDYCLATIAASPTNEDPDSASYSGPEAHKRGQKATSECDVYAFGVLLLELLSGRPSQHPFLAPPDIPKWVKAMRGDEDSSEYIQLEMLVELAGLCCLTSPKERPTTWQVLKMIQKIKGTVNT